MGEIGHMIISTLENCVWIFFKFTTRNGFPTKIANFYKPAKKSVFKAWKRFLIWETPLLHAVKTRKREKKKSVQLLYIVQIFPVHSETKNYSGGWKRGLTTTKTEKQPRIHCQYWNSTQKLIHFISYATNF